MRIGFIAEPYEEKNASGLGYFVLELIRAFLDENKTDEFIIYSSKLFKKERLSDNARNILIPKGFIARNFWFLKNFKNSELMSDVFIFNIPLLPFKMPKPIKTVNICHELVIDKLKSKNLKEWLINFIRDRILMPIALKEASIIAAISNATKNDILKFYKVDRKKIKVIYNGYNDLTVFNKGSVEWDKVKRPFFLFVGKVKYRKNVHGILDAFISFKRKTGANCRLVIAGGYGDGYYQKLIKKISKNDLLEDVIFTGYVDEKEKYALYKNAIALVFPSLTEGFGMPIVEAMSLGTPVITSNIPSTAEVASDAALIVDPFDIKGLANSMDSIFFDKGMRANLAKKGLERAKMFSWHKTAKEYLDLIKNI